MSNSDAWFCIPHAADDTFPRELAKLLKASLKPGLKAYIEYSNETWNTANPFIVQTSYAAKRALALGIAPSWAVGDQWIHQAAAYHACRICQIGTIFQEVFGAETPSRVRLVAASHATNTAITGTLIECLQDSKINPHGVKMDAFAIAPYFGAERNGADITAAMTYARAVRIGGHLGRVQTNYNAVVGAHARVIGYEGGQHFTQNADVFAKNPGAYEVYMAFLDAIAPYIDLFCHYAHCGKWSSGGAWGAKQYTGQPISQAHKYRALVAWAQQNPYQEPSETVSTVPREQPLVPTGGIRATHSNSAGVAVSAMDLAGRLLSGGQIIVRQTRNNGLTVLHPAAAVPYVMPECPAGIRVNQR